MKQAKKLWLHPAPLRWAVAQLVQKLNLLPYPQRVELFMEKRAHYAYLLYQAALLARKLGLSRISAVEFGVAGGNGLLNLEYHAEKIEALLGVRIDLYGFDTGEGLPPPKDYRDLPYHWQSGFFKMDRQALLSRLKRAKILFGDVEQTVEEFVTTYQPAPIGAVFHDLDYYSSTLTALRLFEADSALLLPRIFTYFDDTIGDEVTLYNPYTGQLAAIEQYNAANERRKLAQPAYLQHYPHHIWTRQIYIHHDFAHPLYEQFVSVSDQQLPIQDQAQA